MRFQTNLMIFLLALSITAWCAQVDGGWSDWGNWSLCTRDLNGMQMRARECVNPNPQFGGTPCKGSTTVMRGCTNTNTSSCLQGTKINAV
ncbi:A disintegrin and metalloproteinase with thrombospondin motifs 4-like isoform X2 [Montipora capricornis]|uniref:A disintegrin and metalloproteinase with thrombospondin motifs 4-like isoform X2 n=1 Tax=Montipora capricornis TaxID=246305 RepID=UPI0035F1C312